MRKDLYPKDPHKVPITDFFGSIRPTEISANRINVTLAEIVEYVSNSLKIFFIVIGFFFVPGYQKVLKVGNI